MSTATKQYTQEEVRANFQAAQKMAEPAILSSSLEGRTHNERAITQKMLADEKEPTTENFYRVINQLIATLKWSVKPAKLLLLEKRAAPEKAESPLKREAERAKVVKEADAADAYAKEQSEYEQAAKNLVESFLPMNRRGSVDFKTMGEVQTTLREHINKEKKRGVSMKAVHKIVADEIQRQYAAIERAHERM